MKDFKIANSKPTDTIVGVVIDMSGSMSGIAQQTRDGYNEYIDSLKADSKLGKVFVTLTVFDSDWQGKPNINVVYNANALKNVPKLTENVYAPCGRTPLYDAVGATIRRTEEDLRSYKGNPNVLLVIITDGYENDSKEFTSEQIIKMVRGKESEGWTAVYLGANQDAWAAGQALGIQQGNTLNYAADNIRTGAFEKVAASTSVHRGIACSTDGSYTTSSFFADAGITEEDEKKEDA